MFNHCVWTISSDWSELHPAFHLCTSEGTWLLTGTAGLAAIAKSEWRSPAQNAGDCTNQQHFVPKGHVDQRNRSFSPFPLPRAGGSQVVCRAHNTEAREARRQTSRRGGS